MWTSRLINFAIHLSFIADRFSIRIHRPHSEITVRMPNLAITTKSFACLVKACLLGLLRTHAHIQTHTRKNRQVKIEFPVLRALRSQRTDAHTHSLTHVRRILFINCVYWIGQTGDISCSADIEFFIFDVMSRKKAVAVWTSWKLWNWYEIRW